MKTKENSPPVFSRRVMACSISHKQIRNKDYEGRLSAWSCWCSKHKFLKVWANQSCLRQNPSQCGIIFQKYPALELWTPPADPQRHQIKSNFWPVICSWGFSITAVCHCRFLSGVDLSQRSNSTFLHFAYTHGAKCKWLNGFTGFHTSHGKQGGDKTPARRRFDVLCKTWTQKPSTAKVSPSLPGPPAYKRRHRIRLWAPKLDSHWECSVSLHRSFTIFNSPAGLSSGLSEPSLQHGQYTENPAPRLCGSTRGILMRLCAQRHGYKLIWGLCAALWGGPNGCKVQNENCWNPDDGEPLHLGTSSSFVSWHATRTDFRPGFNQDWPFEETKQQKGFK